MRAFIAIVLVILSAAGSYSGESLAAGATPCERGKAACSKISFTVSVPDFNLMGFRYDAVSWASEDGKQGCSITLYMSQPDLFYGAQVVGFTADLADGAKAGVSLQYARIEILCRKGRISYKDITKK